MKVKETEFDSPDVSEINPVYVPQNATRSYTVEATFINGYGRYQQSPAYWDAVEKLWRYTNGEPIQHEVVKTDEIQETIKHFN